MWPKDNLRTTCKKISYEIFSKVVTKIKKVVTKILEGNACPKNLYKRGVLFAQNRLAAVGPFDVATQTDVADDVAVDDALVLVEHVGVAAVGRGD